MGVAFTASWLCAQPTAVDSADSQLYTNAQLESRIIKFANDMTMDGLISKNDESAYREEVQQLIAWCKANLSLNVDKTKEMVGDFRRAHSGNSLLYIDGSSVEIVKSTKFLGVHLPENFTWSLNTSSITKKAQQHLYFLQKLRKAHLPLSILTMFYKGTIKSILSSCITAWFGNCTISDRKTLQQIYKRHLSTTSNSQTPNFTMAKTKELSKDTRNKIVDLHQAGKTESAIGLFIDFRISLFLVDYMLWIIVITLPNFLPVPDFVIARPLSPARRMDPATSASGGAPLQNTSPTTDPAELHEIIVRQGAIIHSYQDQVEALQDQLRSASIAAPRDPPAAQGESPRLALPDKFDGSADRCRGFLRQCEVFFLHQPGIYREEETQCAFFNVFIDE
ncbi:hypothetical protein QTP70_022656 [Hemibagrus guttatus]|uniref:Alkylated DNA repair protein AlkB homologue 8 N-terminal domain-containing protein n=1 Tax=Hemibagrus guttatus TaxID=175788 RepID=A0AAE0RBY9_9TELE|nr:hypothetical protein QTP70_022656 [Hemibagrus guttatus]KAK3570333.1 hypothetical protein QTP86_017151 [Hemibagrus guttatus]